MAACVFYDGKRLQSGFSSASIKTNKKTSLFTHIVSNQFCATQKSEFMNDILGTFKYNCE